MKKLALLLIGLMAVTVVQASSPCHQYEELANLQVSPPYPNYFGAGEEFFYAAECYMKRGETTKAINLYKKSAGHYKEASKYLVEGGDYKQAALSYERAAKSYEVVGEKEKAIRNYENALEKYKAGNYPQRVDEMEQKIQELEEKHPEDVGKVDKDRAKATGNSLIEILSLIALAVAAVLIGLFIASNRKKFTRGSGKGRTDIGKTPDITKKPQRTEEKKDEDSTEKEKKKSPEERVIQKLRDKYKS